MTENIEHFKNQIILARAEMKNLRQQLSALKYEHQNEVKLIKTKLNELRCASCANEATSVESDHNVQPSTSEATDCIAYKPIGFIETSFVNKRGVPRQPTVMAGARGAVVIDHSVFNNPEHALSGLEEFSHMWIIFHFHATESRSVAKVAPPRLEGERRGVFATRSPHRPCALGLSLVKIQNIEGNKIYFFGVDMVNRTPVLDIKPYIPQYDYPTPSYGEAPLSPLVRPPTEGISESVAALAGLQIDDEDYGISSLSPRLTNPIGINTSSPQSQSPFEENTPSHFVEQQSNLPTPVSPSSESASSIDLLDGPFRSRSPIHRPETERGAPDGQERFTPPQSANLSNVNHDGIRVASWISNPRSQTYEVHFTDDALERLEEMIGDRAEMFKYNIQSLLSQDPRSLYVRSRYPDDEYSCLFEDLSITCVFDGNLSVCTIIAVRNADEMQ